MESIDLDRGMHHYRRHPEEWLTHYPWHCIACGFQSPWWNSGVRFLYCTTCEKEHHRAAVSMRIARLYE